jgi:hypothetical protein
MVHVGIIQDIIRIIEIDKTVPEQGTIECERPNRQRQADEGEGFA